MTKDTILRDGGMAPRQEVPVIAPRTIVMPGGSHSVGGNAEHLPAPAIPMRARERTSAGPSAKGTAPADGETQAGVFRRGSRRVVSPPNHLLPVSLALSQPGCPRDLISHHGYCNGRHAEEVPEPREKVGGRRWQTECQAGEGRESDRGERKPIFGPPAFFSGGRLWCFYITYTTPFVSSDTTCRLASGLRQQRERIHNVSRQKGARAVLGRAHVRGDCYLTAVLRVSEPSVR